MNILALETDKVKVVHIESSKIKKRTILDFYTQLFHMTRVRSNVKLYKVNPIDTKSEWHDPKCILHFSRGLTNVVENSSTRSASAYRIHYRNVRSIKNESNEHGSNRNRNDFCADRPWCRIPVGETYHPTTEFAYNWTDKYAG